jgi:hypothetical protein
LLGRVAGNTGFLGTEKHFQRTTRSTYEIRSGDSNLRATVRRSLRHIHAADGRDRSGAVSKYCS